MSGRRIAGVYFGCGGCFFVFLFCILERDREQCREAFLTGIKELKFVKPSEGDWDLKEGMVVS